MEEITQNESSDYIKMDFSLETPEERVKKVEEIIAHTPPEKLNRTYLEKLADYIIFAMDKQEKKEKKILTDNHMVTVNARETSFEGLVGKLENGEDGIYNMISNDKNILFRPKTEITQADIETVPGLKELRENIEKIEKQLKEARGKRAYLLKKQLIEMRQEQYVLRAAFNPPIYCMNIIKSFSKIDLTDYLSVDAEGNVISEGIINPCNPEHISLILCNYSKLKEDSWEKFESDAKWLIMDIENAAEAALKDRYPMYFDIMVYKIDGKSNAEIQTLLYQKYGQTHSVEYISALWRNKIPKIIAEYIENDFLYWYYTNVEKGVWKKCSRCGQIKLAHNNFFSKNKTSKDKFYSMCKECRNKKN